MTELARSWSNLFKVQHDIDHRKTITDTTEY